MEDHLKLLFPPEEIHLAVTRLANEIRRDFAGKMPLFIGILKGSFIFLSDFVRASKIPLEIDFIRAISYGSRHVSSGDVRITKDIETDITNRHVILVEDIVDTGLTLNVIVERMKAKNPADLKICALVEKHIRREMPVKIDYLGLSAKDGFLVGYGLDYNEKYRYLPGIYIIEKQV
ncbi:MAG: hypoxanthine phosphoribosyltransferase [Deltaproteobacteria bacterium RIFCSPLOWO2_12_FULL_42_16]|nr:MAG: hypoxanthine phosphoribosyltransferase [Deltaproteobacteria bacterium RIFCSPLOWO2_12_FULL_42_16]